MIIKPLSPVFAARLIEKLRNKISKEFRYKIIADHHLNGNRIVGITKPDGKKRLNAISEFPVYISGYKINKIALVMDQEEDDLDIIFKQTEYKLRDQHIQFETVNSNSRFKQYQCKHGSRIFHFILIISGLNDFNTKAHKIEDHLVKGALRLSKVSGDPQDSKETWNSINAHLQGEILNSLLKNKSFSSDIFPQHFNGLRLLEE